MSKDEALKLALEFVEANHSGGQDAFKLITAIKQALEQPVPEPVAWRWKLGDSGWQLEDAEPSAVQPKAVIEPLYTTPPAQEFVCSTGLCHYKPAAQRPWVGLTGEKIQHLVDTHVGEPNARYPLDRSDWMHFARAIEAKLKEKNT